MRGLWLGTAVRRPGHSREPTRDEKTGDTRPCRRRATTVGALRYREISRACKPRRPPDHPCRRHGRRSQGARLRAELGRRPIVRAPGVLDPDTGSDGRHRRQFEARRPRSSRPGDRLRQRWKGRPTEQRVLGRSNDGRTGPAGATPRRPGPWLGARRYERDILEGRQWNNLAPSVLDAHGDVVQRPTIPMNVKRPADQRVHRLVQIV